MAESLTRLPLDLSAAWEPKIVTTDAPRYVPHTEWSLRLRLVASLPITAAVLIRVPGEGSWGLVQGDAKPELELAVKFVPYGWASSEAVRVSFGWRRVTVTDAGLKADPRTVVTPTFPATARTGDVIPIADLPNHDLHLALIAVAERDTEHRRGDRWRIKPLFAEDLPPWLVGLTSGYQRGAASKVDLLIARGRKTPATSNRTLRKTPTEIGAAVAWFKPRPITPIPASKYPTAIEHLLDVAGVLLVGQAAARALARRLLKLVLDWVDTNQTMHASRATWLLSG